MSPVDKPLTILLPVELTPAGLDAARRQLDEIGGLVGRAPRVPKWYGDDADVVKLYKHAGSRSQPSSTTLHLLRIFAEQPNLLTPAQIAFFMGRERGVELTKATVRAYLRNLSRTQRHLLKIGRIQSEILVKDRSRLAEQGSSRFGLSAENRRELRRYLDQTLQARRRSG